MSAIIVWHLVAATSTAEDASGRNLVPRYRWDQRTDPNTLPIAPWATPTDDFSFS